ncbi:hypothetical protein ABH897_001400 [Paenibacillus sp. RC73]
MKEIRNSEKNLWVVCENYICQMIISTKTNREKGVPESPQGCLLHSYRGFVFHKDEPNKNVD